MSAAHPRTPLETVIDALAARGKKPRGNDQGWTALCPAHDDSTPSLSIGVGQDDRVLIHCHAGCPQADILTALALNITDLFTGPATNGHTDTVATYDYVDENGRLLFQVVRKPGKQFRQRRPDGNGGWEWRLGNTRRVLYRLPEIADAIAQQASMFIVEGEKDADRLAAEGYTATCNPHGAGKWRPDYNPTLQGADVVIVADRDTPGRQHAADIAHNLTGIATRIRIVEATEGKDISDHLTAGHKIEDLTLTWDSTTGNPYEPETEPVDTSEWIDPELDEFLDTTDPDYDWLVEDLIERNDRIIVTGDEGRGKSTLLRQIAIQLASGIHPFTLQSIGPLQVLYIDCENSARQVRRKLRDLRAAAGTTYMTGRLRLRVLGHAIDLADPAIEADIAARILAQHVDVIIIGPLYKLIVDDPIKEMPAKAVADTIDRLRQIRGSAILIEAHSPYAEGSGKKRPTRPYGASLWSRWPEFGIHLGEDGKLTHWRGQRDERNWPTALEWTQPWPWGPAAITTGETSEWNGPTECAAGIVALLTELGIEMSVNKITDELRARGHSYRNETVRTAARLARNDGRLSYRVGPRSSDLYRIQTGQGGLSDTP